MVFIKYHTEKVECKNSLGKPIKRKGIRKLEKRIRDLGWKNLKWCPHQSKEIRYVLYGLPPNYDGEYEDYCEEAIMILASPGKPWENSGEISVRNYLKGPVFSGPKGKAWY